MLHIYLECQKIKDCRDWYLLSKQVERKDGLLGFEEVSGREGKRG